MRIAIIPARGGSKRIPRKNIKQFCGKPMIAWSIEAAKISGLFERIICSTDDEEIAFVAREFGAETPFLRPAELSGDHTGTIPVVAHAIKKLRNSKNKIDIVCCIYATAPFIQEIDLKHSLEQLEKEDANYCFAVTNFPFPIQRAIRITKENRCEMLQPEMRNIRSQDLEETYHDAGQLYWGRTTAWLGEEQIFSLKSTPYILPRYLVQDIDTDEDWLQAELMFKALKLSDQNQ
jgi:pseudaminic acid cytidylyltransferase